MLTDLENYFKARNGIGEVVILPIDMKFCNDEFKLRSVFMKSYDFP